jgi:hypothetical protein
MKEMVLTITPEGRVEHTLKDSFFDTRFLGRRRVERMTSVNFDPNQQKFYIMWLRGPFKGFPHTTYEETLCAGIEPEWGREDGEGYPGDWLFFESYEAGVQREIELVNELRLQGFSFESPPE